MKKVTKIVLALAPVAICSGCVLFGHTVTPEEQEKGVSVGTGILNAVAGVTGQAWAIPLITACGAVLAGALNAHHGVRNVTVATAKGIGGLAVKAISAMTPAPKA